MGIVTKRSFKSAEARLSAVEAADVLFELQYQAERRLIEACQEFQDIAFEMEWRLPQWQALLDQRRWLQRDIDRSTSLQSRFNVSSRLRTGKTPQDSAWARHQRAQRAKLLRHEEKVAAAVAAIVTRNAEGAALEQEITQLQQRCERIEQSLKGLRRPHKVRSREEKAAEMARMGFELADEPDIGDIGNLLIASELIDRRLRRRS
jgi:hypothetical protein